MTPPFPRLSLRLVIASILCTQALSLLHASITSIAATGIFLDPIITNAPALIADASVSSSVVADAAFLRGLAAGAVSRVAKEALLHPIDTIKTRMQLRRANDPAASLSSLYRGVGPALVSGVPAGALFFGVKDYSRSVLRSDLHLSPVAATVLAVCIANIPYWLLRSPAELIKTKQQSGALSNGSLADLRQQLSDRGLAGLYGSYLSNLMYSIPADVIKFLSYEAITTGVLHTSEGGRVGGLEAAAAGGLAAIVAQIVTTPLDVVRTRVMEEEYSNVGGSGGLRPLRVLHEAGSRGSLMAGVGPRVLRALCSGLIQFASYEVTQNALSR